MFRRTFISREYRFKLRYPLFWRQVHYPDVDVFLLVVNTFGPETFNIVLGPCGPDYRPPEVYASEWIQENRKAGNQLQLIGERTMLVCGVTGYEINYASPTTGIVHKKVSVARNGYEYVIDYGTVAQRFKRYESVFNQITASIRWL